nr:MgtC/SapB family protein [Paenibacillus sp. ACRRX]
MATNNVADPWFIDNVHLTIRLLLAMLLGGLVGLEREQANHPAGLRTHILVCMGSALIMLLSIYGFSQFITEGNVRVDPARLATAVITGIGFLGAGTIIFTGKSIAGLTTAASLWVVAAIGLAVGAGFYFAAILTTVLVIVNLFVFSKLEQRYMVGKKPRLLMLETDEAIDIVPDLNASMLGHGIAVKKMTIIRKVHNDDDYTTAAKEIRLVIIIPKHTDQFLFASEIERLRGVRSVTIE